MKDSKLIKELADYLTQILKEGTLVDKKNVKPNNLRFNELVAAAYDEESFATMLVPTLNKLILRSEQNVEIMQQALQSNFNIDMSKVAEDIVINTIKELVYSPDS